MRITLLGGDARMPYAAEALGEGGHEVSLCAHGEVPLSPEVLSSAEAVLLPHPLSRDGVHLFAPMSPLTAPLSALLAMLPEGVPLLAGATTGAIEPFSQHHRILSYGEDEGFLARNARITAEGALSLLMQRLPKALADTPCLILGSGRLARALASLLAGLSAPHSVFARNPAPLPGGIRPLPLTALPAEIGRFSVLINTVPVRLLDASLLRRARAGALLLELAAVPDVVDPAAVSAAGMTLLSAPPLPGRYAPPSAGRALAEAALRLISFA